jgi:hypothetical protein
MEYKIQRHSIGQAGQAVGRDRVSGKRIKVKGQSLRLLEVGGRTKDDG